MEEVNLTWVEDQLENKHNGRDGSKAMISADWNTLG